MGNFDDLVGAVAVFGPDNRVIFDDTGMPSIMVGLAKPKYSDVITGGTEETLPFWIVDGEEKNTIWVSKFLNVVENDRAYSLGAKLPKSNITFDQALTACRKKGNGWHLNQNGVFAYINLLSYKLGTVPHGNTDYGADSNYLYERGIQPQGEMNRVLTGSGRKTWYHNHDTSGIADICGNLWEWTAGMRLMDGEIQIIPYGNSMKIDCDMSAGSTLWKAIMPDGTLVEPKTPGTLKIDGTSETNLTGRINVNTTVVTDETTMITNRFKNVTAADGVDIPKLLIALGLYPDSSVTYGTDSIMVRNNGEKMPFRGSAYHSKVSGGPSAFVLHSGRSNKDYHIGFRSAYYE